MKKLLFLGSLQPGGSEHQMVVIASILKKEGYDVTYLCGEESNFFQKDLDKVGIPIIRIKENKISSLFKLNIPRTTWLMRGILRNGKYDTVISFIGDWNFYNCFFARRKNTAHKAITGIRNNRDSVFLAPKERFYTYFEKYADVKVSNSDNARRVYAEHFPQHASKLTTIYNYVDLPEITSEYSFRKNEKTHVIVPASYRAVKNPMKLLEALALMNIEEKVLFQVDWYGNIKAGKNCYEEMSAFIKDHGLHETITLHDVTNDIANRINEADVVGIFSTSEGLPNAVCEGMMLGKPIIMTRVSDYDVLVDDTNGYLCESNNAQSIKNALISIVKLSDEDMKKMGIVSKIKAEHLFSKEVVIKQWEQII